MPFKPGKLFMGHRQMGLFFSLAKGVGQIVFFTENELVLSYITN